MNPVIFLLPAEEEMLQSARYYESQVENLGISFLKEIGRSLDGIMANPEAGPRVRNHIRRRLLRRFPFAILYRLDPTEIVIIAVVHLRRKPGYWHSRIAGKRNN